MSRFLTLGIETSCDETSVAIVNNGREILSNTISSQIPSHQIFGGVVPEIASRLHLESINYIIEESFKEAGVNESEIDLVAVTKGPGLVGALLVGISGAKALSLALDKPIICVNHIEGHVCANYLSHKDLKPPFVSLIVSGGHTYLCNVKGYNDIEVIGRTLDDAAGESYDKVSRALGLGYPGGPAIQKAAEGGEYNIQFTKAMMEKGNYDFSFSGLKTAVLNYINQEKMKNNELNVSNIAMSFQSTVNETLTEKAFMLVDELDQDKLVLSGGVASNKQLREMLSKKAFEKNIKLYFPEPILCTDNARMIASSGYFEYMENGPDDNFLKVYPNLGL
mgnify:FL=1